MKPWPVLLLAACGVDANNLADADLGLPPIDAQPRPDAIPAAEGACKRGVAYNRENGADAPAFSAGIGWWYNWAPLPDPVAQAALSAVGVEFVPMVWTGPPNVEIDVEALIRDIPEGSKYLLGFNEPNFGVQANLTPEQAAAAWPQLEAIADARDLILVSPAVNYCGGDCNETEPVKWMDDFFAACTDCRVDHVAIHWYACNQGALEWFVGQFAKYGKPIWVTEFSCLEQKDQSEAVQIRYMDDAVPVLENDPRVFRYSWFIGRSFPEIESFNLFGAPGELTTLGKRYVGYDGACLP